MNKKMNILRNFITQQPNNPETMNKTSHEATLQKFNDRDNKPVFENPQDQGWNLSKRTKIIIIVVSAIVVVGLAVGLGLGLTLGPNSKIVPMGQPNVMQATDGNAVATQEVQFQQVSRWRPRLPIIDAQIFANIRVSVPFTITPKVRNLQEGDAIPGDYMIHVDLKEIGMTNSIASDGSMTINVDVDKFIDHLENQVPPEQRLLTETETDSQLYTVDDVKEELGQVIRKAFDVPTTVRFEATHFETWVKNETSGDFQIQNETSSRLLTTRKLWSRRWWDFVQPFIVPAIMAVAKPVTQAVKESQKDIAEVAKDIKAEAQKVADVGAKVSAAAKKIVKECIPKGDKKLLCQSKDSTQKDHGKGHNKWLIAKI